MKRFEAHLTAFLSALLGGGSMLVFMVFLYAGSLNLVVLGLDERRILYLDAGLSLLFFVQHSVMIRSSFRKHMIRLIPDTYGSAFYSIASGAVLLVVILLWQESATVIAAADTGFSLVLRAVFFLSLAGFYRASKVLKAFDPFGIRRIKNDLQGREPRSMPFIVKGPYRWVRHPLYFFMLLAIWSCPTLTTDRLVFNALWTIWIVVGAMFEERDLVAEFGDAYLDYQRNVPMLIPCRFNPTERS